VKSVYSYLGTVTYTYTVWSIYSHCPIPNIYGMLCIIWVSENGPEREWLCRVLDTWPVCTPNFRIKVWIFSEVQNGRRIQERTSAVSQIHEGKNELVNGKRETCGFNVLSNSLIFLFMSLIVGQQSKLLDWNSGAFKFRRAGIESASWARQVSNDKEVHEHHRWTHGLDVLSHFLAHWRGAQSQEQSWARDCRREPPSSPLPSSCLFLRCVHCHQTESCLAWRPN
jgi:hypothetical protein